MAEDRDILDVFKFTCPICKGELHWETYKSFNPMIIIRLKMVCTHCNTDISLPVAENAPCVGIMMTRPSPTKN